MGTIRRHTQDQPHYHSISAEAPWEHRFCETYKANRVPVLASEEGHRCNGGDTQRSKSLCRRPRERRGGLLEARDDQYDRCQHQKCTKQVHVLETRSFPLLNKTLVREVMRDCEEQQSSRNHTDWDARSVWMSARIIVWV